jgi:hypothetical protein
VFRFSLQLLSETFLILRIILLDIVINVHRSSHKVPVILVRVEPNLNFLDRFSENHHMSICPVGGAVIPCGQTDGQTWRTAFRNFANAPRAVEGSSRRIFENVAQLRFCRDWLTHGLLLAAWYWGRLKILTELSTSDFLGLKAAGA